MKYNNILDSENYESKPISCVQPIDIFFQGLAATVKTFSPEYQHMTKNKLFAIVSDLEWAQLQNKTVNNQIPASSEPPTTYFCSNSSSTSSMSMPGFQKIILPYGNRQFMRQEPPSNNTV